LTLILPALEAAARQHGWATGTGSVAEVRTAARRLGWEEVATRAGEHTVVELRPIDRRQAPPHSLSATYGFEVQPLHTDGAHLANPPDLVILCAVRPNETSTLLWTLLSDGTPRPGGWNDLAHGVFLVQNGRDSFFTTAGLTVGLRYDPGCMLACDERARNIAQFFKEVVRNAHHYQWAIAHQALVIDNSQTLHARAALRDEDRSRLLHRIAFRTRKTL
jgi:alpha-ketoglutarate-dependent taurine dioxygenase